MHPYALGGRAGGLGPSGRSYAVRWEFPRPAAESYSSGEVGEREFKPLR